ncbi:hypothetical protein [Haloferula sargassicola]|uniref:Uncharacterized protein n=1 Tax=Haloferula sargassicola TaxID=490096 RepID=A0ABP9UIW9_9BACT
MKTRHLLPPLLAVLVVGLWLGSTQARLKRVQTETKLLQERIEKKAQAGASPHGADAQAGTTPAAEAKKPIDWKEIGEALSAGQRGGMPDLRVLMKMQARLLEMDRDELVAALDEIAALDLSPEIRQGLEQMLVSNLAEKEPQLVLERYLDRVNDSRNMGVTWSLAQAFGRWMEKDPTAAQTWFDARIAAGDFDSKSLDGRSDARLRFESALIGKLLKSDPAAASERLKTLPEDQRADIFRQGGFSTLADGTEKDFAALVRDNIPEGERGELLAQGTTMKLHQGGYESVSAFLDKIDATAGERQDVAKHAAIQKLRTLAPPGQEVKRRDVDEMLAWLSKEAPEKADRITGEALGSLWTNDIERRADMVEKLSEEGGGDEVLIGFLDNGRLHQQRDLAQRLAEKIQDAGERERLLKRIGPAETEQH